MQGRISILAEKSHYFAEAFEEVDTMEMPTYQIDNDFPTIGSHNLDESASAPYASVNNILMPMFIVKQWNLKTRR